jgi:ABC-type oligopeptide transport system substrate-binding subunit
LKRYKFTKLATAATALMLFGAACGGDTTGPSTPGATGAVPEGGTLIDGAQLATADNLTSFDPGLVQTLDEAQVTYALYDGLTDFDFSDATHPVLKPLVAEGWTSNSDATEFTFTIKKGQVFSNGDPVLPSSFKFAWVRAGKKSFASQYGYLIDYVKDGSKLQSGEVDNLDSSIMADDNAMTLKVILESPFADFPAVVSHTFFMPLPEKLVSPLADQHQWDKGLMIGNGPFKMEKPKSETEVDLVRNDLWAGNVYGDTRAKLDRLVFKISKDPESAYTDFEAGNLMSATIPSGRYADARAKYHTTSDEHVLASYYFDFGFTDPTFAGQQNVKLRQAISLAIDRDEINQKVYESVRTNATGITPPGIPGYKEGLCNYCKYDPDQAKKLLQEWKDAGNQLTGPITIDYNTGGSHQDVVSIIQQNLKAIGIDSKTNPVSEKYFTVMPKGGCHFCRSGWSADYPTYGNFMVDLFSETALGGNNLGSFNDPTFNDLVAKALSEPNDEKRASLYEQAEDYLLNTATATVPINWYNGDQAYADNVVGYVQGPLSIINWERVGVKQ